MKLPKKLIEQIVEAVKAAAAELTGEQLSSITDELASVTLKGTGLAEVGADQTVIKQDVIENYRKDLKDLRARKNELEDKVTELEEAARGGDNKIKRDLDAANKELETLKPRAEHLAKVAKTVWERYEKDLPVAEEGKELTEAEEKLRGLFQFPEEGKELTDEQLAANIAKYDELSGIGTFSTDDGGNGADKSGSGGGDAPRTTRTGSKGTSDEEVAKSFYANSNPGAQGNAR